MTKKRASAVAVSKTVTSRPVLLLWSFVSVSVALLCAWSYSQPAWILRPASEIGSLTTATATADSATAVPNNRAERSASADDAAAIIIDSIQEEEEEEEEEEEDFVVATGSGSGRSAIPLVQIGLFDMCIYSNTPTSVSSSNSSSSSNSQQPLQQSATVSVIVTCVPHEALDDEWLPPAWQVTRAVCGAGCLILFACAAASVAVAFIDEQHQQQRFIKWTAVAQLTAAILMLVGLCAYPLGLGSETLHHFCDQRCQPGWSSLVAGMSSAAAFLCPVIASLVSNPIYNYDLNQAGPWEAYLLL